MTKTMIDITPKSGFADYGGSFENPQGAVNSDGLVVLQGLLRLPKDAAGNLLPVAENTAIGSVPVGYAPKGTLLFRCDTYGSDIRVDVKPSGDIVYVQGPISNWVSLSGITFYTTNISIERARSEIQRLHGASFLSTVYVSTITDGYYFKMYETATGAPYDYFTVDPKTGKYTSEQGLTGTITR
jgi:hypothetical protein